MVSVTSCGAFNCGVLVRQNNDGAFGEHGTTSTSSFRDGGRTSNPNLPRIKTSSDVIQCSRPVPSTNTTVVHCRDSCALFCGRRRALNRVLRFPQRPSVRQGSDVTLQYVGAVVVCPSHERGTLHMLFRPVARKNFAFSHLVTVPRRWVSSSGVHRGSTDCLIFKLIEWCFTFRLTVVGVDECGNV